MATEPGAILSKRFAVLQALTEAAKTKPILNDELDFSRSTIDRAVNELLDAELIKPTEIGSRTYQLTPAGKIGIEVEATYRKSSERVSEYRDLLNSIPSDAPVSNALITDSDVYYSPRTPDIAFRPGTESLADADKMRGTATVVREEYLESLRQQLDSGGFQLELVLESKLLDAIESNYEQEFADISERDAVDVYITEESLPYALWIIDQENSATAGMTIHEDVGVKGTIVNESDSAVKWLESEYLKYREKAIPIE